MTFYKFRFDFEIGNLVKSPCKTCDRRIREFPDCIDRCEILDKIQRALAEARLCSREDG